MRKEKYTMKRIVTVVILLLICVSGCGKSNVYLDGRFEVVERVGSWCIIVDNETKVLYLQDSGSYRGGITVILNPDGTPMTLKE